MDLNYFILQNKPLIAFHKLLERASIYVYKLLLHTHFWWESFLMLRARTHPSDFLATHHHITYCCIPPAKVTQLFTFCFNSCMTTAPSPGSSHPPPSFLALSTGVLAPPSAYSHVRPIGLVSSSWNFFLQKALHSCFTAFPFLLTHRPIRCLFSSSWFPMMPNS